MFPVKHSKVWLIFFNTDLINAARMNMFIWNVGKQWYFKGFLDEISCYVYIQHLKPNTGVCALRYTENTLALSKSRVRRVFEEIELDF